MNPKRGEERDLLSSFGLTADDLREMGYAVRSRGGDEPVEPGAERPTAKPRSPRSGHWAIYTLLVLMATAWVSSPHRLLPRAGTAVAPDTSFSSARAMVELAEMSRTPRPLGSPEHDRVRDHLLRRLTDMGLEPEVQAVLSRRRLSDPDRVVTATVRNVIARMPGTTGEGALLLTTPYDGGTVSPAAGHGAFGLVAILETVRALAAGPPLEQDVVVVFTDGDRLGSLGAHAFAEEHPWAEDVTAVLTVDALGATGPVVPFETGTDGARHLIRHVGAGVHLRPSSLMSSLPPPRAHGDEPDPLRDGSAPGLSFLALGDPSTAGQPWDSADRVEEETLQHAGLHLLSTTRSLGMASGPAAENEVRIALPLVAPVRYPERWVVRITLALVVLFALVGTFLKTARVATWKGLLAGLATGLAPVVVTWWLGGLLLDRSTPLHPEHGWVGGAVHHDGPYVLALLALAVALVSGSHALARRWIRRDVAVLGALAAPLALCVWLTFRAPLAAYTLQWPLALAILSALAIAVAGAWRARSGGAWGLLMVLSAVGVVVAAPSLELVAAAWTFERAAALGGLFAIAVLLLAPLLEWMLRPKAWLLPTLALALAGAMVMRATPGGPGSLDGPVLSSLVYLTDEEVPRVLQVPGAEPTLGGAPGSRFVVGQWLTVPGRGEGEQWARSLVAEDPTGSTDPGVLLLPHEDRYEIAGAGPDGRMAPPGVRVVRDSIEGPRRAVTVGLASSLGGEMVGLHLPDGVDAALVGVSEGSGHVRFAPARSLTHWGPGDSTWVDLSVGAEVEELVLTVLEHHLRPGEVLGQDFFRRPEGIVPNQDLGSDRLIQRTTVRLPLRPSEPEDVAGTLPSPGTPP